jgi:hypothetical protein
MRRQSAELELELRAGSPQEVAELLAEPTTRAEARHWRLRYRIRDTQLYARQQSGRYTTFPVLRGRLVADRGGVLLRGTAREAHTSLLLPRVYAGLAIFLAAGGVAVIYDGELMGMLVCWAGAVLFALLARAMGRQRRGAFVVAVDELRTKLSYVLPATDEQAVRIRAARIRATGGR